MIGTALVIIGVILLLTALLALLAPDILEDIALRVPMERQPIFGWQMWFSANLWVFLIGGAIFVWAGTSLRR